MTSSTLDWLDAEIKTTLSSLLIDLNQEGVEYSSQFSYQELISDSFQELAAVGLWFFDFKSNQLKWTRGVYKIFGKEPFEIIKYEDFLSFVYSGDRDRVHESWTKAEENKKPYEVEYRIRLKHKIKWLREKVAFICDEYGQLSKVIGIVQDISKIKEPQLDLENLKDALDSAAIIAKTDVNGKITYVNDKFCEISQYSLEELIGKTHRIINSSYHPREFWSKMWEEIQQGKIWKADVRNRAKGGSYYWMQTTIVPILNVLGEIEEFIAIRTDITAQKQLEQELLAAKNKADENAKIKENFLAQMSHEIRTPMNGVLGFTELLLEKELSSEQRNFTEGIYDSAKNLLRIVNDILDVSKIESGSYSIHPAEFNLRKKIEQVFAVFQPQLLKKDISLSYKLDAEIQNEIIGDAERLGQVLINLIGNALKFTEKGKIKLKVKIKNASLLFEIIDTGRGIPKEKQETIFESFTQVEDYQTRKYSGTGLGLFISKKIVELMGGYIGLDSEPGKGSIFYFVIPYQKKEEFKGDRQLASSSTVVLDKEKSILVVEDHPLNQKLVRFQLQLIGLKADFANNGLEALERIKKSNYQLILMDIQMPIMNGIEATEKIRAAGFQQPIIAMTAHAFEQEKANCLTSGMNAFLTKPFKKTELRLILEKYL